MRGPPGNSALNRREWPGGPDLRVPGDDRDRSELFPDRRAERSALGRHERHGRDQDGHATHHRLSPDPARDDHVLIDA